jgi:hypothetical protein
MAAPIAAIRTANPEQIERSPMSPSTASLPAVDLLIAHTSARTRPRAIRGRSCVPPFRRWVPFVGGRCITFLSLNIGASRNARRLHLRAR